MYEIHIDRQIEIKSAHRRLCKYLHREQLRFLVLPFGRSDVLCAILMNFLYNVEFCMFNIAILEVLMLQIPANVWSQARFQANIVFLPMYLQLKSAIHQLH